jgi:phosphate uptake regulator
MLHRLEGLVSEALQRAITSLKKQDAELAEQVIHDDEAINQLRR